jgi:hypothetical protein
MVDNNQVGGFNMMPFKTGFGLFGLLLGLISIVAFYSVPVLLLLIYLQLKKPK